MTCARGSSPWATASPSCSAGWTTLPQAMPHGDASPQNLLVPASAPDRFVAIDVGMRTPHAIGFDLGQLLVGLVHAGVVPAASCRRSPTRSCRRTSPGCAPRAT